MELQTCKTCKIESNTGINILGVHICSDCLNSISNLEIGETNYDYYKDVIGDAWNSYYRLKLN